MNKVLITLGIIAALAGGAFYYFFIYIPPTEIITLYTPWGETIDKDHLLQEYPRPQFERKSYLNLNGIWQYALRDNDTTPEQLDGDVLVPFSIETPLSGVQRQLLPGGTLWYRKEFDISTLKNEGRYFLHFGAVDQYCEVLINGNKVGSHDGGYAPFYFDITEYVREGEKVILVVKVVDNLSKDGAAYGKQSEKRGGIWYTATSGIWQTVWVESVPKTYLQKVKITPNYDDASVTFLPFVSGEDNYEGTVTILDDKGNKVNEGVLIKGEETTLKIENFNSWSPESPYLYTVKYTYGNDIVDSYFGMRKFSIGVDAKGTKRLFLNNEPYFHNGLLDQGYWSDGYYTAPSDEALKYDIIKMKSLGFNMLRKHIKIEPLRWYYHCDKIGMLVWQDQVSGGYPYNPIIIQILPMLRINIPDKYYSIFGRKSELGRKNYYRDLERMIDLLYNVPSISTWVPFNEGWGQFDALKAVEFIQQLDTSRHIDHASGWHDQKGGDFRSLHIYFVKVKIKEDKQNRAIVLSEFGGYSHTVKDHVGTTHQFGYAKYDSIEELNTAYRKLYEKEIIPQIEKGLSATVYTQVSDVEDEVNGILTYDRKVCKANEDMFKEINSKLHY